MAGSAERIILSQPKVIVDKVRKVYQSSRGEVIALNDTNLTIHNNEFICVVGPSGCGKTTLLNILAGLDDPTSGEVRIDGKLVHGPSNERGVVFQQYALFPWLTVKQNVEFGLKLKKMGKGERKSIAEKYIETVGLKDFANAFPKELSGGMKQRVAIARAYAVNPKLLLLDEPFGALDAQTRTQLQVELLKTWEQEQKTCFFITHDVEEAVLLASRVVVMSARPGRIKTIIDIDLKHPRTQETRMSKEFNDIKNEIWSQVYEEYLEAKK
ncbi:MAG: ABC transporter ATP-binding protein [Candidatus Pristimantibacillus lignocellulolyticus]|uniref:ABC transporter ATP-binding protein n=1 Tax=Candidatus Pristimantibacillus lignocellulolyticus TaxID=2994561 RepID=A0A9J6ZKB7_9BACL|nr:MAG: ABC transporter ATP-binding protein [Candidatus Pristimantibacillus lignocellulolyticus]